MYFPAFLSPTLLCFIFEDGVTREAIIPDSNSYNMTGSEGGLKLLILSQSEYVSGLQPFLKFTYGPCPEKPPLLF